MKRLSAILAMGALLVSGLVGTAPPAAALEAGTFTVSGWSSGNLTVNDLTIERDAAGSYRVKSLTFTVGSRTVNAGGFRDQGCTPNGAECRIINAGGINVKDNSQAYWFIASLAGMDGPSPTLTMFDAKTFGNLWDGFGTSPSTGLAATLIPSMPTLTSITPNTAQERGGGIATILGTNLTGATSVSLGARAATIVAVTDTQVVISIPVAGSNPVGTAVDVSVTTPLGTATLPGAFTYTSNPPSVSDVAPACGVKAGTPLTITGMRLTGATAVTIGGAPVAFTVTDASHIAVPAAPTLADVQSVVVTTPAGSSSGLATVSYRPCAPLPTVSLTVRNTVVAGGFATIEWSFPPSDPNLANVAGLQYAFSTGGPYANIGGTRSGTTGTFTVSGLTRTANVVWVRTVHANPALGRDSVTPVGVRFSSTPTALPPNTGNAGSVAPPAPAGSTAPGGADTGAGSAPAAVDAPCLAPVGSLYPTGQGTVGSQLLVAPGRPGQPSPTGMAVTAGALPPGIGLDAATGIALGVPTAAGQYSATVVGRYPDGSRASGTLDITIANDAQTLTYPAIVVGVAGRSVSAGPTTNAPVGSTYEIVCGTVPPGTTFDPRTGVISGIPTTVDLENPPLRIVERNAAGSAAASFAFVVVADGGPQVSYPAHPHLRKHTLARVRPTVVGADEIAYFKVIRGKLNKGLRLNPKTGLITGRPIRATGPRPHHVTVAAVLTDGTLLAANPMTLTVRHRR